jgi:hypothetical protein
MTDKVVYLHIRNDINEVFYVGIGSIKRAFSKFGRNSWWKRITDKISYTTMIYQSGLNDKEAKEIEMSLIKKFRQKGLNLCNLTDGGDGRIGSKQPQSFIDNHRQFMIGNKFSLGKPFKENIIGISLLNNDVIKFNGNASIKADKRFDLRSVYRCANRDKISKSFSNGIHRDFQFFWESDYLRKWGTQNYTSL